MTATNFKKQTSNFGYNKPWGHLHYTITIDLDVQQMTIYNKDS